MSSTCGALPHAAAQSISQLLSLIRRYCSTTSSHLCQNAFKTGSLLDSKAIIHRNAANGRFKTSIF